MSRTTNGARRSAHLRRSGRAGDRRRAVGMIVVLLLALLVVGTVAGVILGLNTAAASMKLSRDEITAAALQRAKEALIARAALDDNRPGSLPCPDLVTNIAGNVPNDGNADMLAGNDCPSYIGRLPWRTLGLPDLRDASGERLWYALSPSFRDDDSVAINSDTQGVITVEGASVASGVVAIVFAPGAALGAQIRDAASANTVGNYLEAVNPYLPNTFLTASGCSASACTLSFGGGAPVQSPHNDQLLLITHEDLFRVVEPVVQRRIEQEIVPLLTNPVPNPSPTVSAAASCASDPPAYSFPAGYLPGYFEAWGMDLSGKCQWLRGFFPFAAPYQDVLSATPIGTPDTLPSRVQGEYRGRLTQITGLLPVSRDTTSWVTWSATASKTNPISTGIVTPASPVACSATACTFTYECEGPCEFPDGGLDITVSARLRNAAGSFVLPTGITDPTNWNVIPAPSSKVVGSRSFDAATGDLVFTVALRLTPTYGAGPQPVQVTLPTPQFSGLTASTNWFVMNGWHRQTAYTASGGFTIDPLVNLSGRPIDRIANQGAYDASPPCGPAAIKPCVTVLSGPTTTDARAVLVLAGRNLAGGARTYTIANYFELKNADVPQGFAAPPNLEFERQLRSGDFNDRVVVVAPEPLAP